MTNDVRLNFGHVAFPYLVEEALTEGASYRPDPRVIQTKRSITGLKEYFKKHVPPSAAKKDGNEDNDPVDALYKMFLELKINSGQENEAAQRNEK